MNPGAAGWKLALLYVAWLLASVAMALIAALLVGAVASLFGVDSMSAVHQRVVEITAVGVFVLLAVVPFVVRRRVEGGGSSLEPDDDGA
jgi:membrane protein YdbS with pleckstrin-like domain